MAKQREKWSHTQAIIQAIAGLRPMNEGETSNPIADFADQIGEKILGRKVDSHSNDNESLGTYEGHPLNRTEDIMRIFGGGPGGVRLTKAG